MAKSPPLEWSQIQLKSLQLHPNDHIYHISMLRSPIWTTLSTDVYFFRLAHQLMILLTNIFVFFCHLFCVSLYLHSISSGSPHVRSSFPPPSLGLCLAIQTEVLRTPEDCIKNVSFCSSSHNSLCRDAKLRGISTPLHPVTHSPNSPFQWRSKLS